MTSEFQPQIDLLPFECVDFAVDVGEAATLGCPPLAAPATTSELDATYQRVLPALRVSAWAAAPAKIGGGHHWLVPLPAAAASDDGDAVAAALDQPGAVGVALTGVPDAISPDVLDALDEREAVLRLPPLGPAWWQQHGVALGEAMAEATDAQVVALRAGGCPAPGALRVAWEHLPLEQESFHLGIDLVSDWETLRVLFRRWDRDRLIWGSGLTLAAQSGAMVALGDELHPVTSEPQPWSLSYSDGRALALPPILHGALAAFHIAANKVGVRPVEAHAICANNAIRLLP